jgi:hypothetical protein
MSSDISVVIQSLNYRCRDNFSELIDAIENWGMRSDSWAKFKVASNWPHDDTLEVAGPLSADGILRYASNRTATTEFLSAWAPIKCRRWQNGRSSDESAILDVRAWGDDVAWLNCVDARIEGNAEISINPSSPYIARIGDVSERAEAYNQGVSENLSSLGDLLISVAERMRIRWFKVFLGEGMKVPFNSHCTYYASHDDVIADLQLIREIWNEGIPGEGGVPPLSHYDAHQHAVVLCPLRSVEQRQGYWSELSKGIEYVDRITPEVIEQTLALTSDNVKRIGGGFVIFNYPYYMNSLVGDFYVDLLEVAGCKLS